MMELAKKATNYWFQSIFCRKKLKKRSSDRLGLSRCLTTTQLISLGVGATLGAGTYVVTGQVAANIAGPAVVLSFVIAAFTSILSGLCYAEFGSRVPETTGSAYTYSYVTVGEIWAFMIGWNLVLEYMIGTAADAAALSASIDYAIGYRIKNLTITYLGTFETPYLGEYPDVLSFVLTIIVTFILALGVRESANFTTLFNIFNVAVVIFIIVTGLFFVDINNWTGGAGFFPYGASGVISGAATCFYAFVGFDIIATTGEEAENPGKSIPIAIVASLLIVFFAYFGVSSVVTLMVSYDKLDRLTPIPDAFRQRGLSWANYIISVGAICGLSSSLLGNLFPLPRIIYAMSNDGLLFKLFSNINKKTEVPVNATIYPGIMTALFGLLFDLEELVEMMSIGTLLAYTLVSLSILILRYQPGTHADEDESDAKEAVEQYIVTDATSVILDTETQPVLEKTLADFSESSQLLDDSKDELTHDRSKRGPTLVTGRIVTCSGLLLIVWFVGFNSTILFSMDAILDKSIWAIGLLTFFGISIIVSITVVYSMPQSKVKVDFMAPCVPALPILAMYFNVFLMLKLSTITWVRFAAWMIIGTVIYLFYGTWHSKVRLDAVKEEELISMT